jgi:hypothetical protein
MARMNKVKMPKNEKCEQCGKEVPQVFQNLLEPGKKLICGACLFSTIKK